MSTYFMQILANQRPFPIGADENDRAMYSCNFIAVAAAPVNAWEECVVKVLQNAGIVIGLGTDTFVGPKGTVPIGDGPYVQVIDTGGLDPLETQDGHRYERLSVQVIVRARSTDAARTKALAAWRALDGLRNSTVAV